jgi:hypothetical protein
MRPTEIKDLVAGILAIIFVAMALGQYGWLERFARCEMAKTFRPTAGQAFFPKGFGGK